MATVKRVFRVFDNMSYKGSGGDVRLTDLPRKPDGLHNLVFNEFGQLETRKGYAKYNSTTLSADDGIVGMHRYYMQDTSSKEFLVACGDDIYKLASSAPHGGTSIIGSTELDSGNQTFFTNYYGTCYIVNGANGLFKYDGTDFYKVGLAVPTAPTFNSNTGINGSLSEGNYLFAVTYVDVDGYEGNGSAASSAMPAGADPNDGIKINIPVSTDSKVAKRRIYRTTVGGITLYYDQEVSNNTATTANSTQADTALSAAAVLHSDHDAPPATPHLICKRRSRLVLADGDAFYISHIADVEYFPVSWVIYTGARQKIAGLTEQMESLPVFTEDSIERLVGQDEDNFEFQNAFSSDGCIATRSLVNCNNLLVYLGSEGVCTFNGVSSSIIHRALSEYVKDNINEEYASLSCAVFYNNMYMLSYPKGASTTPSETVYIDFSSGAVGVFDYAFGCYCRWDRGGDGVQLFGGSSTEGRVYKIGEATTDDGEAITSYDHVEHLDFGTPERKKIFYAIYVKVTTTSGTSLRMYYQLDDSDEAYKDVTMEENTTRWYRVGLPDSLRGRALSFRPCIYDSTPCPLIIDSMDSTTGWGISGDKGTVSVNNSTYLQGTGALNLTKTSTAAGSHDFYMTKTISQTNLTGQTIKCDIYIKDSATLAKIDSFQLFLFCPDVSNYLYATFSPSVGWNYLSKHIDDFSVLGSPSKSNVQYIRVDVNAVSDSDTWSNGDVIVDFYRAGDYPYSGSYQTTIEGYMIEFDVEEYEF